MNCKLCIFDLDGTLTDTIHTIAHFSNNALNKFGFDSIDTELYKIFVGDGAKTLIVRCLTHLRGENGADEETVAKVLAYYNETYNADFLYKTTVYDGIMELLTALKSKGIKISVFSNKPHETTIKVLEAMFPKNTFDIAYGAREGVPLKPNCAGALDIIDKMQVNKEDCLYIGDTATDMQTGKNAGLFTVGVLWGFRSRQELEENNADLIVAEPMEIARYLGLA